MIYGMYRNRSSFELGLERLLQAGFTRDQLQILEEEREGPTRLPFSNANRVPIGATVGAALGAAGSGILVGLIVSAREALEFMATGPLFAAIAGGIVGAIVGGLIGAVLANRVPTRTRRALEREAIEGAIKVGLDVSDDADQERVGAEILEATGAQSVGHSP